MGGERFAYKIENGRAAGRSFSSMARDGDATTAVVVGCLGLFRRVRRARGYVRRRPTLRWGDRPGRPGVCATAPHERSPLRARCFLRSGP